MMKLLCLTQPWASLMAIGAKTWETRGWGTPYRGEIAIAATKGFPEDCKELSRSQPFRQALDAGGIYSPAHLSDVLGHILCVVDLRWIAKVTLNSLRWPTPEAWFEEAARQQLAMGDQGCPAGEHERHFGNYLHGRSIWMTNNLRRLATPVPVVGHQGLRDLPAAKEAEVRKQLP